MNNDDFSTTSSSTPIILFRLHCESMKVNHIKCEERAIYKAQQNLKITQDYGTEEEIAEAQEILDDAISDKENASKWMHPNNIIEKLSQILNQQIKNLDDKNVINYAKKLW